ncbi:MAG: biotin--[acetyl-CoA-carboxylase] ligase [Campylobacter sp.]|nr:biotin--[acetyl-CoA-carboxylase] ligase [Campylobacter sp.]
MVIEFIESINSTQDILVKMVKSNKVKPPYAIVAKYQSLGVGSRGNIWESEGENLHFSFCIDKNSLSEDILPESVSIYFAFIMKEYLASKGSKLWLKWPNDFYLDDKKIGGVISNKIKNTYICGIGINLVQSPTYAKKLDIEISVNDVVKDFLELLENKFSWKEIFSKFLLEFKISKNFTAHIDGEIHSLKDATLCSDGSIVINNKKVYSLR